MKTNSFIPSLLVLIISSYLLMFNACKKEPSNEDQNSDLSFEEKTEIEISINNKYQGLLETNTPDEARQILVDYIKENNNLKNVKLIDKSKSIWWEYSNSAHIFRTDTSDMINATSTSKSKSITVVNKLISSDKKSGNNFNSVLPHNKKALILSPYQYDFDFFGNDHLITEYLSETFPEYDYEVTYKVNNNKNEQNISLEDFKSFSNYGIIIILSHGDVYFSDDSDFSGNFLGTGVFVSEELDKKYETARSNFGLITSSTVGRKKSTYYLSKNWFDDIESKENTLVYFSVCYGGSNVKYNIANSIISNNSVYVSWNNIARPFFTSKYDRFYFDKLLQGYTHSEAYNTLQTEMGCFDLPLIEESCQTDLGISEPSFKIVENGGGSAPVAEFTANTTTIIEGESVSFTDLSTNNPTSWSWNFGDGATSTSQNPSHTYNTVDTYTVSLTSTNSYGSNTKTKNDYITVADITTITIQPGPSDGKDAMVRLTVWSDCSELYSGEGDEEIIEAYYDHLSGCAESKQEGLIEFSLSQIPSGANIVSAKLKLYSSGYAADLPSEVNFSKITSMWDEASVAWDIKPTSDYIGNMTITTGGYQWHEFDITSTVQDWVNGTSNYGLEISISSGQETGFLFYSSDHADSGLRPKLVLSYY